MTNAFDSFQALKNCRFLLVDDMAPVRTLIREHLVELGANSRLISQAATGEEALELLKKETFDVVFADYNLGKGINGQQLLDQGKESKIVPDSTSWVMLTAESTRELVSIAAANSPDTYIIKPFSRGTLQDRLGRCLSKKAALEPVLAELAFGDTKAAIEKARQLAASQSVHALEGSKLEGKLLMTMGDYEGAKRAYKRALSTRSNLPFAILGLAQAFKANGETAQAQTLALDLRNKNPELIAAYDLLLEIYEEQGADDKALEVAKAATKVVPAAKRFSKLGKIALAAGDLDTAAAALEKAANREVGTALRGLADVALLTRTFISKGEAKRVLALIAEQKPLHKNNPAADILFAAAQSCAQKALGAHAEAARFFDLACEASQSPGQLDDHSKHLLLTAAAQQGSFKLLERLVIDIVNNNHDHNETLNRVRELVKGTSSEQRVDTLIAERIEWARGLLTKALTAKTTGEFPLGLAAVDELLATAPQSAAGLAAKASILVAALQANALDFDPRFAAERFLEELDAASSARGVPRLIASLRKELGKAGQ